MDTTPGLPQQNRRLAAVMFLDMCGYSAMMAKDEALALACVGALEKLLRAEIPKHGGRLVKFLGDGSMAEFPTALASVTCSQSLLSMIEANNAWVPPEKRYAVRIGLNLGELVDVQDDIFSDTVNVAALETVVFKVVQRQLGRHRHHLNGIVDLVAFEHVANLQAGVPDWHGARAAWPRSSRSLQEAC